MADDKTNHGPAHRQRLNLKGEHHRIPGALLALPLVLLLGCGHKQASRSEVQSALLKSISLASESEIFIQYLGQGRSTSNFALGHLQYLRDEITRTISDNSKLNTPPSPAPLTNALAIDNFQLRSLQQEIDASRQSSGQPGALDTSAQRIRQIRITLQKVNSSL